MALDNLTPADNSTKKIKRVGRGAQSRTGYSRKRGFEGGQQPLQRRLPKVGFTSKIEKPYVINIEKITAIAELSEITVDAIRAVHKMSSAVIKVKLIGANAKELASKIKDENVSFTGTEK